MNADEMQPLYELCQANGKPIVMHVGRAPNSEAYRCDSYQIFSADKLQRVLMGYPRLKVCVPHLGFDEIDAYRQLIEKYDTLWLDTTMVLTDYFSIQESVDLRRYRLERVMYGSDFPNIPYAWDRELKWLRCSGLSDGDLEWLLNKSAAHFFKLDR
jgi:predicted TIM-barrel fold metal-dependent hydrolase